MKAFFYTIRTAKPDRYGGTNVVADIYRIKNNMPIFQAAAEWNTASYPGDDTSVMRELAEVGAIPKKYSRIYYSDRDVVNFVIHKI